MKVVLRSIKPYWLYLIIIGKKRIEVGKSFPKADDWSRDVVLYCSKDMKSFNRIPEKDREWMQKYLGKVACRFVCDDIIIDEKGENSDILRFYGNLTHEELLSYGKNKTLYGWHITDLVVYDEPRELSEFETCNCSYVMNEDGYPIPSHHIKSPPQSWCYVERSENGK